MSEERKKYEYTEQYRAGNGMKRRSDWKMMIAFDTRQLAAAAE